MGYAIMFAPCARCKQPFGFNPTKVPSLDMQDGQGKQPLCHDCFEWRQAMRADMGLPAEPDHHPDAYEPCPEEEL